ncbi:MAG: prolyl oligopeptidase family serine peptidase [Chitinophagales bacterium]
MKKKYLLQSTFLILIFTAMSCQQTPSSPSISSAQLLRVPIESSVDQKERDFFLYLPKGYKQAVSQGEKLPVLLFLHGDGERGNGKDELDFVITHGPLYEAWVQKRDLPFIIIGPQLPMFGRDTIGISYLSDRNKNAIPKRLEEGVPEREANFETEGKMKGAVPAETLEALPPDGWEKCEQDLLTMIDLVLKNYNGDSKRLYLSGISYGGYGTWYMASKHAKIFAAISPVVGWGHPDLMPPIAEEKLPVWAFAGGRDYVVQTQYFFEGLNKLEELGHDYVRFTIHEDMDHDTWKRVFAGEDIYNWFLQFSKP